MRSPSSRFFSVKSLGFWVIVVGFYLLLTGGAQHYWDEYYYLYGLSRHGTGGLLSLESGLENLLFPPSFFSAKVGFLLLVEGLLDLFGSDPGGIEWIRWFFLLLIIPFAGVHYLLFREAIGERLARWGAVAVFFIPVTLYLGGKILTEVPSTFFAVASVWFLTLSFRSCDRWRVASWIAAGAVLLAVASLYRFTAPILSASLVLGLMALRDSRFPLLSLIVRGLCLGVAAGIMVVGVQNLVLGRDLAEILGLAGPVLARDFSPLFRLYALGVGIQLMAFPILMAFPEWRSPAFRFGLIWTLGTLVPIFTMTTYVETRYMVIGIGGLALLAVVGIDSGILSRVRPALHGVFGVGIFLMLAVVGNSLFARFFPIEIDEADFDGLLEEVAESREGDPVLATGWVTDFCYLRMLHPEVPTFITWCGPRSVWVDTADVPAEVFTFFNYRWIGPERRSFFQDTDALYVGWAYNPSVTRLMETLSALGIDAFAESLPSRLGLSDHLTLGWPWRRGWLVETSAYSLGDYSAYEFRPNSQIVHTSP